MSNTSPVPLDYRTLIVALRSGFARQSSHPIHMRAETGVDADNKVLLVKAAWDQDVTVVKAQTLNRSNKQSGLPYIQGLIAIFDKASGTPLAIVDAKEITNRRTAGSVGAGGGLSGSSERRSHDPDRHGRAGPAHGACTCRDQTHSTNQCLRSKPGQGRDDRRDYQSPGPGNPGTCGERSSRCSPRSRHRHHGNLQQSASPARRVGFRRHAHRSGRRVRA